MGAVIGEGLLAGMPIVLEFNVGLLLLLLLEPVGGVGTVGVGAGMGTVSPFEYPMGAARLRGFTLDQSTVSGSGGA